MHPLVKDLTGLTVGYLTVSRYIGPHRRGALWEVLCTCGKRVALPSGDVAKYVQHKRQASCGCMRRATIGRRNTKHGMSSHPAYAVYHSMRDRCLVPSHQAWRNYGARGITVCERWVESFDNFWADMGPTYRKGLTLERRENNLGYSPENCEWATVLRQHNNTRNNTFVETPSGRMTAADAARHFGVKYGTLLYRLRMKWPIEKALGLSMT
jgi:hypothetical protein